MSDRSFDHVLAQQYTVFDGLGGMHIEDLYQDRHGFLWIATADGASAGLTVRGSMRLASKGRD